MIILRWGNLRLTPLAVGVCGSFAAEVKPSRGYLPILNSEHAFIHQLIPVISIMDSMMFERCRDAISQYQMPPYGVFL